MLPHALHARAHLCCNGAARVRRAVRKCFDRPCACQPAHRHAQLQASYGSRQPRHSCCGKLCTTQCCHRRRPPACWNTMGAPPAGNKGAACAVSTAVSTVEPLPTSDAIIRAVLLLCKSSQQIHTCAKKCCTSVHDDAASRPHHTAMHSCMRVLPASIVPCSTMHVHAPCMLQLHACVRR